MNVVRGPVLDFAEFHRHVLPDRLAGPWGAMAGRDVAGAPAIAFRLGTGIAYRYVPDAGGLRVDPGDDAPVLVELDAAAWGDFAGELATTAGLLYGGRVRFVRGGAADLERWEPALRALFCGRPILDPARMALRDRRGEALETGRSFSLADADEELRHFLLETGFLHVRGVFTETEIEHLRDRVERLQRAAGSDDGRSWWSKGADGARVLSRVVYASLTDPRLGALADDPRLRRLAALAPERLVPAHDRSDGVSVVLKHPGVVEGLADLPWHRDCGLGGHPVTCPAVNVGVQLDAASEASGRLTYLAGSWRGSCHRRDLARSGLPVVAIDTEPGDVTLHLGDVLHAAPPPTAAGPGRRTLYVTFVPPRLFDVVPAGRSYNDVVRTGIANPSG